MAEVKDPWQTAPVAPAGSDGWQTSPPLPPSPAVAPAADPWGAPTPPPATQPPADPWNAAPVMFNPAKDSPATAAQMATVMAAKGSPAQQLEAIAWARGTDVPSDGRIYAEASKNNVPDWTPPATWGENSESLQRVMGNEPDGVFPRYFVDSEGLRAIEVNNAEELESVELNGGCEEITAAEYVELKDKELAYDERERKWTEARVMEAEERGRFINALNETRGQEYVVSQDGELDKVQDVIPTKREPDATGVYIAYKSPSGILHAILSGPYDSVPEATQRVEAAYSRLTADSAFKLAFEGKFDRVGLYYAEIPLSRNRKGAYGKL